MQSNTICTAPIAICIGHLNAHRGILRVHKRPQRLRDAVMQSPALIRVGRPLFGLICCGPRVNGDDIVCGTRCIRKTVELDIGTITDLQAVVLAPGLITMEILDIEAS